MTLQCFIHIFHDCRVKKSMFHYLDATVGQEAHTQTWQTFMLLWCGPSLSGLQMTSLPPQTLGADMFSVTPSWKSRTHTLQSRLAINGQSHSISPRFNFHLADALWVVDGRSPSNSARTHVKSSGLWHFTTINRMFFYQEERIQRLYLFIYISMYLFMYLFIYLSIFIESQWKPEECTEDTRGSSSSWSKHSRVQSFLRLKSFTATPSPRSNYDSFHFRLSPASTGWRILSHFVGLNLCSPDNNMLHTEGVNVSSLLWSDPCRTAVIGCVSTSVTAVCRNHQLISFKL